MTPERLAYWKSLGTTQGEFINEFVEEIERLQIAFDGIVTLHDVNLRELERLNGELAEQECTCGSGAHPRHCLRHPQGFDLHVAQLNYEGAQDSIQELERELEQAKERIRELEVENVLLRKAFDGAIHPHTFTTGSTEIKDHS